MKYNFTQFFTFCTFLLVTLQYNVQAQVCNGVFEEQNGLLTIEMESGDIPNNTNWQTGSEADPNLANSTINYIFWNGTESFNALSGAPITYNIKINTPGTYRFVCRGRIGTGTSSGEHNDFWLRIEADDFFVTQGNNPTAQAIEPMPDCESNPNRGCADDAKVDGYFKAFMNRSPTGAVEQRWGFVTNSRFNETAFRHFWATFNSAGNYSIIIDARSSFFFMDKMVLRKSDILDSTAQNLSNPESTCNENPLSISGEVNNNIRLFPNPATNTITVSNLPASSQGKFVLRNILGATVRELNITSANQNIDISDLKSGMYFISSLNSKSAFTQKFIKL